jgi:hypothetical protein
MMNARDLVAPTIRATIPNLAARRSVRALVSLLGALFTLGSARPAAAAPEDEPNLKFDMPSTYEFAFVSVGITQAWSIAGRALFLGAGGGIGPALYRISQMKCSDAQRTSGCDDTNTRDVTLDRSLEIAYGNAFVRVSPIPYLDLDVGPKLAIATTLYDVPEPPRPAFVYGGYADLRVGSRTIKFGPRFEYSRTAYADFYQNGWKLTALMVRVVH